MNRSRLAAFPLAALVVVSGAISAVAADPAADGVRLRDGTYLPPMPAGMLRPSTGSQMLAQHAKDAPVADAPRTMSVAGGIEAVAPQSLAPVTSGYQGPAGTLPNHLRREVLGFLPYWYLAQKHRDALRYDQVSTISYFSIGVKGSGRLQKGTDTDPSIGWSSWNSSAMTDVINRAHAQGVRVVPTITMMAWDYDYTAMTNLLTSDTRRSRFIAELVATISDRNADGVNLDFEPVPTDLRDEFTAFVRQVKGGLEAAGVGSFVTVDTMAGAASWATGYDVQGLTADGAADALMVMAYDLSWSGSSRAGGVAPIDSPYVFSVTDALNAHLNLVSAQKLIWGIPYYGRAWNTKTTSLYSTVRSPTDSVAFVYFGRDADGPYGAKVMGRTYGKRWDSTGRVRWVAFRNSSGYRQAYYDDPRSLRAKYRLVNRSHLGGIGIWSLGMDTGTDDLWNVIGDQLVKQTVRLTGNNRYQTASLLSRREFGSGVPVAYVASGRVYHAALTAGPAASRLGGPVLLAKHGSLPATTAGELARLNPARIVLLGPTSEVGHDVLVRLRRYTTGSVTRIGGGRYVGAARLSAATFKPGVRLAYVAAGHDYAGQLVASSLAAREHAPLLLTGSGASVRDVTAGELRRLDPRRIVVVGSSDQVSDSQLTELGGYTDGSVSRIAGGGRYATAAAASSREFDADGPRTAYVANGSGWAHSLALPVVAARDGAPVLLSQPDWLPAATGTELRRLNSATVYVIGEAGSVNDSVLYQLRQLWD